MRLVMLMVMMMALRDGLVVMRRAPSMRARLHLEHKQQHVENKKKLFFFLFFIFIFFFLIFLL
jgi:hypothetical protein